MTVSACWSRRLSWAFSRSSPATRRTSGWRPGRPRFFGVKAARIPSSRCRRHSVRCESTAPLGGAAPRSGQARHTRRPRAGSAVCTRRDSAAAPASRTPRDPGGGSIPPPSGSPARRGASRLPAVPLASHSAAPSPLRPSARSSSSPPTPRPSFSNSGRTDVSSHLGTEGALEWARPGDGAKSRGRGMGARKWLAFPTVLERTAGARGAGSAARSPGSPTSQPGRSSAWRSASATTQVFGSIFGDAGGHPMRRDR